MGRNWKREALFKWRWEFWAAYWYGEVGYTRTGLGARWKSRRAAKKYWG